LAPNPQKVMAMNMNTYTPVMLEGTWPSHQPVWSWLHFTNWS